MPSHRRASLQVPSFALYGEAAGPAADLLHIEEIASRSRLYRWEIAAHVHEGLFQVVWLRAGSVEVTMDDLVDGSAAPAAIVVPPGAVHAFRFAPDSQGWVLTLSLRSLMDAATNTDGVQVAESFSALFEAPAVLRFDHAVAHGERIAALLRELAAEFAEPAAAAAPVVGWLARSVVWRLAQVRVLQQRTRSGLPRQEALFTRFVELVERHHLEHWPVTRYAQQLGLSAERLNRIVRASAQRSALEHIHERLLREACRRLIYIAAPVSTLAFELGFEDPAYFCRFFKRHLGVSPSRYRARRQSG